MPPPASAIRCAYCDICVGNAWASCHASIRLYAGVRGFTCQYRHNFIYFDAHQGHFKMSFKRRMLLLSNYYFVFSRPYGRIEIPPLDIFPRTMILIMLTFITFIAQKYFKPLQTTNTRATSIFIITSRWYFDRIIIRITWFLTLRLITGFSANGLLPRHVSRLWPTWYLQDTFALSISSCALISLFISLSSANIATRWHGIRDTLHALLYFAYCFILPPPSLHRRIRHILANTSHVSHAFHGAPQYCSIRRKRLYYYIRIFDDILARAFDRDALFRCAHW